MADDIPKESLLKESLRLEAESGRVFLEREIRSAHSLEELGDLCATEIERRIEHACQLLRQECESQNKSYSRGEFENLIKIVYGPLWEIFEEHKHYRPGDPSAITAEVDNRLKLAKQKTCLELTALARSQERARKEESEAARRRQQNEALTRDSSYLYAIGLALFALFGLCLIIQFGELTSTLSRWAATQEHSSPPGLGYGRLAILVLLLVVTVVAIVTTKWRKLGWGSVIGTLIGTLALGGVTINFNSCCGHPIPPPIPVPTVTPSPVPTVTPSPVPTVTPSPNPTHSVKRTALLPLMTEFGTIGPFVTGRSNCLRSMRPCKLSDKEKNSSQVCRLCVFQKVVRQIQSHKNDRLVLMLLIGSADKFDLHSRLKRKYGSNEGLARRRAEWVRGRLFGCQAFGTKKETAKEKEKILTLTEGPDEFGKTRQATQGDRSVRVFGLWTENNPTGPVLAKAKAPLR